MNIFLALLILYTSCAQDLSFKENTHYQIKTFPNMLQQFLISPSELRSDSKYEIRISYLGTLGAGFSIYWEPCSPTGRKMLDTEKLVFSTDSSRRIIGLEDCTEYKVNIKARRESKGRSTEIENGEIWYDVIMEHYNRVIPVPESVVSLLVVIGVVFVMCCIMYINTVKGFNRKTSISKNE